MAMTLRELIVALEEVAKKDPKTLDMPVVASSKWHDNAVHGAALYPSGHTDWLDFDGKEKEEAHIKIFTAG
jgi:hypothetical protein